MSIIENFTAVGVPYLHRILQRKLILTFHLVLI